MKKCSFGCVVLMAAALCASPVLTFASSYPVYHQSIAKVRYMPQEPLAKVLLIKDQQTVQVEVKGSHTIYDPYTGKKLDSSFLKSSYPMKTTVEGITWGQQFPGVYQILIIADEPSSGIFINGVPYGGVMAFYQVKDRLSVVNWLTIDDLTTALMSGSILPRETDQKEALAAYAIAIRSKIFQKVQSSENAFFDVAADDCQYKGLSVVRTDGPFVEAMRATKKVTLSLMSAAAGAGVTFTQKALDDIRRQMPMDDAHKMAKEGKDAKAILHKFYPGETLCIADSRSYVANNYLK